MTQASLEPIFLLQIPPQCSGCGGCGNWEWEMDWVLQMDATMARQNKAFEILVCVPLDLLESAEEFPYTVACCSVLASDQAGKAGLTFQH